MSREIKFRAWNSLKNKMIITDFHITCFGIAWKHDDDFDMDNYYTIMQYTGLKDKNGVEIYFDDIVEYETTEGTLHKAVVSWNNEMCCVNIGVMPYPQLYQSAFIQPSKVVFNILGNIHSNPELL